MLVIISIYALERLRIDDPVGAISVHGVVGIYGLLAVVWSDPEAQLLAQLIGIGVLAGWSFAVSAVVWWLLKRSMGLRIHAEAEYVGADVSECGLEAYPEFVSVRRP